MCRSQKQRQKEPKAYPGLPKKLFEGTGQPGQCHKVPEPWNKTVGHHSHYVMCALSVRQIFWWVLPGREDHRSEPGQSRGDRNIPRGSPGPRRRKGRMIPEDSSLKRSEGQASASKHQHVLRLSKTRTSVPHQSSQFLSSPNAPDAELCAA
jgi:hypothetical protein